MRILFLLIFLFSFSTQANKQGYYYVLEGEIPKDTKVTVTHFTNEYGGVFIGYTKDFDGEGDYYFRAEHLAEAMNSNLKTVLKNAKRIKGRTITLKKKLKLVAAPPSPEGIVN